MNAVTSAINVADKYLSVLHTNPYVSGALGLFLVMYAGMAAPALPASIAGLFENSLFKLAILSLVLIMRNYNPTLAILVAIGFVISMNTLSNYRIFAMASELDNIVGSPTRILRSHQERLSQAEHDMPTGTHGTHGDKHANMGTTASWLDGMTPEGLDPRFTPGYDGKALATYGTPESQL